MFCAESNSKAVLSFCQNIQPWNPSHCNLWWLGRSLHARSLSLQGWGLIDLPLRAAFSPAYPIALGDVPFTLARALNSLNLYLRERPRLPFTARIERAQFHRARSASKKGTWPLPPHPSEAARCASTEDHQPPSPPLLPECETSAGVVPAFLIVHVPRAKGLS